MNKHLCLILVLLLIALSGEQSSAAKGYTGLQCGAAEVSITPDVHSMDVPLGGYAERLARPCVGVHDDVYAHAIVLKRGSSSVAIVSMDLCFLPASIHHAIELRLKQLGLRQFAGANLFLAATHSHSAPDPLAMDTRNTISGIKGWTVFNRKLLDFTAGRAAEAVKDAVGAMEPVTVTFAAQAVPSFVRNRRNDPVSDTALTVVNFRRANGSSVAVIVHLAAHPTIFSGRSMEISSDFPGVIVQDIQAHEGGECRCLFLNGAEGDASAAGFDNLKDDARVKAYGHAVSEVALKLLTEPGTPENQPQLKAWYAPVNLPPTQPDGVFMLAAMGIGLTMDQAKHLVKTVMPTRTEISLIRVGQLLLMGFPCEPTGAIGMDARSVAQAGAGLHGLPVALVNDWLGYALTPQQYKSGRYEAGMSFYGPDLGPTLLNQLKHSLLTHLPRR